MLFQLLSFFLILHSSYGQSNPCEPNPCATGQKCIIDRKFCFTDPCLQYKCANQSSNDDAREARKVCPDTESYNKCGRACEATCETFKPTGPAMCSACQSPGCTCKTGFVRRNAVCIHAKECPSSNTQDDDPCNPNPCSLGSKCVSEPKTCFWGNCKQYRCITDKPGKCPTISPSRVICSQLCDTDADCSGENKCCSHSCGKVCAAAVSQQSNPCSPNPCAAGEKCVVDLKMCFTQPCPQYKCQKNSNAAVSPCNPNPCPSGQRCQEDRKFCFTTPCPQYQCIGTTADPCTPNPCPTGQICYPDKKYCTKPPCPQYKCLTNDQSTSVCNPSPCKSNERCVPSKKTCFRQPCPQYYCITDVNIQCGLNEYLNQCGNQCEKTCDNYFQNRSCPQVCGTPTCTCKQGFVRSGTACIVPNQCPNVQCKEYEVLAACGNQCEKTCENYDKVTSCAAVCERPACVCKTGYVRSGNACVLPSQCNKSYSNPCEGNPCGNGYSCVPDPKACITGFCFQYKCRRDSNNIPKAGQCPSVGTDVSSCVLLCNNDADCTGALKCCSYGCGRRCLTPVSASHDPCAPNPCSTGFKCVPDAKFCATTPCSQYKCVSTDPCSPNPCGAGYNCIAEPKQCFTTPCQQYRCQRSNDTGRNAKPGVCPSYRWPVAVCVSGCEIDSDCLYNWKCCSDGGCVKVCMRPGPL